MSLATEERAAALLKFISLNHKLARACFVIIRYFLSYKKQLSESQILEGRPKRRVYFVIILLFESFFNIITG